MIHTPPINIATIENEARLAARTYTDVNACCPYPFQTNAGQIYRNAFYDERAWLTRGTVVHAQARS